MRIAIIGYGKMGHMIEQIALERGHEIACAIDRFADRIQTTSLTEYRLFLPEEGFNSEAFRSADVAIEFSTPSTAKENILRAWAQGVPVVCGTTSWNIDELRDESLEFREVESGKLIVEKDSNKPMLVWKSNFSVGVNIFFELNKFLAKAISSQLSAISYQPSIKEIHHIHKLDKPSGTAKTLQEAISHQLSAVSVPIESIREGEVPGTHEVTWDSEEDTIIITHIAKGRRGFALGAVLAAEGLKR